MGKAVVNSGDFEERKDVILMPENFEEMRKDLIRQGREEGKRLALIDHALILMRIKHMTPEQILELFQVPKKQRPGLLKTLLACVKQKSEKFKKGST